MTTIIAFGGYLYPIAKWLPSHVIHYAAPWFGFRQSWLVNLAKSLRRPVTLIGFSAGANAAMVVAAHSPMVRQAVIHSCEDKKTAFNSACDYRFFATLRDTTPTLDGTIATVRRAILQRQQHSLEFLPMVALESPTWFEARHLVRRNHIFHNVLPRLAPILES